MNWFWVNLSVLILSVDYILAAPANTYDYGGFYGTNQRRSGNINGSSHINGSDLINGPGYINAQINGSAIVNGSSQLNRSATANGPGRVGSTPPHDTHHTTSTTQSPVFRPVVPKRKKPKVMDDQAKEKLKETCQYKPNKCKGQMDEYNVIREHVKESYIASAKIENPRLSDAEIEKLVNDHLDNIKQLKLTMLENAGLNYIEPADDGLWAEDIKLTPDDVERMMVNAKHPIAAEDLLRGNSGHRAAAAFFEMYPDRRWKMPIHYWLSPNISDVVQNLIDAALQNLTEVAPCIQFVKDDTQSFDKDKRPQIQYLLRNRSACSAASPLGFKGINQIDVSIPPDWCLGQDMKAVLMHETIHSLGGDHEQNRSDRDEHIKILWENIDPQMAFNYNTTTYGQWGYISTSYGVPYDYNSRMHYVQGTFQRRAGLKTMVPVDKDGNELPEVTLGGLYLTPSDILQLNRMYCVPETCKDSKWQCGNLAIQGYCDNTDVKESCPRSCGLCDIVGTSNSNSVDATTSATTTVMISPEADGASQQ